MRELHQEKKNSDRTCPDARSGSDVKRRSEIRPDPVLRNDLSSKPRAEDKRISGLIGLAEKAGKIKSGEFAAEVSIKSKKARLCLVAEDASDRTRKHFTDMCSFRNIPLINIYINKDSLGHAIGRDERSVLTIEDRGFSRQIIEIVRGGNACGK